MAVVTDSSLLSAAHEIVSNFLDKKASLNDGVIKKASELGLNSDQTSRLIERTNTEAFLRIYPGDTEFEVASPEVVLGIKTASITPKANVPVASDEDGLFKAASVEKKASVDPAKERMREKLASISPEEIFGMDTEEFQKTAAMCTYEPAIDRESAMMLRTIHESTKLASEINQEEMARNLAVNDAIEDFEDFVKQAALSGTQQLHESEAEVLNMYPQAEGIIRSVYDDISEKFASAAIGVGTVRRAASPAFTKYASASPLTIKFNRILTALEM